jgi:oxalate decarboxylase
MPSQSRSSRQSEPPNNVLEFIGVYRASRDEEVSLSNWLTYTPLALVALHLNVDEATTSVRPSNGPGVMPR